MPTDTIAATVEEDLTQTRFPCVQCGAMLNYAIGTNNLACDYCGHQHAINTDDAIVEELNLAAALRALEQAPQVKTGVKVFQCSKCAAQFSFEAHIHAGQCPYCATPIVAQTGAQKRIQPKALLPFSIDAKQAQQYYAKWLTNLWFAPNVLKKYLHKNEPLRGVYIPYWTYDSHTTTHYAGMRGTIYYTTQHYTAVVNGRPVRRTRSVPKIRWAAVNGTTRRNFDDVLIGATQTIPRKITDSLAPWDLQNLVPYSADYLSGFSSEIYQVEVDEGFQVAQAVMDNAIRQDVQAAIGGDQQKITHLQTQHENRTFKHILLPLWLASYNYNGKTYRFVVNGRNGVTRGERPYSMVKIVFSAIAATALLGVALFGAHHFGWLDQLL